MALGKNGADQSVTIAMAQQLPTIKLGAVQGAQLCAECLPRGAATDADGVTSGLHATGPTEPQKLAATEPLKLPEQQLAQQLLEQVYVKARTTVERLAGQRNSRCGFQAQRPLGRLAMAE